MLKTYHGSCDCGKCKFEAKLDLTQGTFKCNCRICAKGRFWGIAANSEDLKVLEGADNISMYGQKILHHFCKNCGMKLFCRMVDGKKAAVSLAALDDLDPQELAAASVRYVDGRHDNWAGTPAHTTHLN